MKVVVRFCLGVLLAAGVVTMTAETCEAQWGFGSLGSNYAYPGLYGGYGFRPSPYSLGQVPVPPYFALHPPVYYSQPVARPYGYSPFAYPGWVRTPEIAEAACEPLTLDNPYVTPSATDSDEIDAEMVEAEDDEFAIKPLVIENPFVLQRPQQAEATELAAVEYVD